METIKWKNEWVTERFIIIYATIPAAAVAEHLKKSGVMSSRKKGLE